MKTILILLLSACILGTIAARLQMPQPKKVSLKKSFFKNFLSANQQKLNITTQCNNVNITEYNGVSLSGYLNVGI